MASQMTVSRLIEKMERTLERQEAAAARTRADLEFFKELVKGESDVRNKEQATKGAAK